MRNSVPVHFQGVALTHPLNFLQPGLLDSIFKCARIFSCMFTFKDIQSVGKKLSVEFFLMIVPKIWCCCIGVAICMDIKKAKPLLSSIN